MQLSLGLFNMKETNFPTEFNCVNSIAVERREKEPDLAAEINSNWIIRIALSANGQTQFIARDKLKLVRSQAEGYLTSLSDEVKIIVNWLSKEDDELNQYRLRIYQLNWIRAVVVVSNITVFPGRKIADITPRIICFACDYCDLFPDKIMLVEHYSISNLPDGDVYFHLLFVNNETIRHEISKDKLAWLIGKPI